jgi:hypothetical protein
VVTTQNVVQGIGHGPLVLRAFVSVSDGFLGLFHPHWGECPHYFVDAEVVFLD